MHSGPDCPRHRLTGPWSTRPTGVRPALMSWMGRLCRRHPVQSGETTSEGLGRVTRQSGQVSIQPVSIQPVSIQTSSRTRPVPPLDRHAPRRRTPHSQRRPAIRHACSYCTAPERGGAAHGVPNVCAAQPRCGCGVVVSTATGGSARRRRRCGRERAVEPQGMRDVGRWQDKWGLRGGG